MYKTTLLSICMILMCTLVYPQTNYLKTVKEINDTLHFYSEMCEGNVDNYTVKFFSQDKKLIISTCSQVNLTISLNDVSIYYLDEGNKLNYSICFSCKDKKDCIKNTDLLKNKTVLIPDYKIELIFPEITAKLVDRFKKLKQ